MKDTVVNYLYKCFAFFTLLITLKSDAKGGVWIHEYLCKRILSPPSLTVLSNLSCWLVYF